MANGLLASSKLATVFASREKPGKRPYLRKPFIICKIAIIIAGAAAIAACPALAAGATGRTAEKTVDVKLNANISCSVTTKALDFGTVTSVTGGKDRHFGHHRQVHPGRGVHYVRRQRQGQRGDAAQDEVDQVAVTDTVDYAVYRSDGTTAWPTTDVAGTGASDGSGVPMTLVGKLTQANEFKAAPYADTLTFTVDY